MASRALSPVTVRRDIADSDSSILTPVEQSALALCRQRAAEGKSVTQLDITLAIGSQNFTGSTAAGVLNRLERKGHIERTYYQRGVQVCITETGECTAPPSCQSTHWRDRDQDVPTPPLAAIKAQHHPAAHIIEAEARKAGRPLHEFLMDLVFNGLELHLDQQEQPA
jgi:hypothetical protein